jgi:hypothetical protein
MPTPLLEQHMARAKRNDRPVKIDATVLHEAQVVAASKGIPVAEYLSELLRPLVKRDLLRQAKEALKGRDEEKE